MVCGLDGLGVSGHEGAAAVRMNVGRLACGYRSGMSSAFLYTSPDRVFYRGPLGQPRPRVFGAAVCYVGLRGRLRWAISQAPLPGLVGEGEGDVLALPPGVGHHIAVSQGPVLCYLIEPEFVDLLPGWLSGHVAAAGSAQTQAWRASPGTSPASRAPCACRCGAPSATASALPPTGSQRWVMTACS